MSQMKKRLATSKPCNATGKTRDTPATGRVERGRRAEERPAATFRAAGADGIAPINASGGLGLCAGPEAARRLLLSAVRRPRYAASVRLICRCRFSAIRKGREESRSQS